MFGMCFVNRRSIGFMWLLFIWGSDWKPNECFWWISLSCPCMKVRLRIAMPWQRPKIETEGDAKGLMIESRFLAYLWRKINTWALNEKYPIFIQNATKLIIRAKAIHILFQKKVGYFSFWMHLLLFNNLTGFCLYVHLSTMRVALKTSL